MKDTNILNSRHGVVDNYTIVLSTRYYKHLGQISGIDQSTINIVRNLNSAHEISFSVYKKDIIKECNFLTDEEYEAYKFVKKFVWENLVDFKLIWVKELDTYFNISVSTNDSSSTVKTVTGTSLCEAELSNYLIDSLEVNTADDMILQSYNSIYKDEDVENNENIRTYTIFWDEQNPHLSLLHRIFSDKAPHYKILHVDDSLRNEVREFSVSDTDIYSFLTGEVSEQFNCIFIFDSTCRGVYVYDLYTVCQNPECDHLMKNNVHYRDDYNVFLPDDSDIPRCPICGSTNVKYFGEDTTILVDKKNLTDEITLSTNADDVKNCLKLVAGDDTITSIVQTLNPNGTDYLYYFSEFQKNDMPEKLVSAIEAYNKDYENKNKDYQEIVLKKYDASDRRRYLESSMMPTIEKSEVKAETEAKKLAESFSGENPDVIALKDVSTYTALETVNSALKMYARLIVNTGYVQLKVNDGATFEYKGTDSDDDNYGVWTGFLTVTSYADKTDTIVTDKLTITVTDNHQKYVDQVVSKKLNDVEEGSVFDVLAIKSENKEEELKRFTEALKSYCYKRLESFRDAIQGALDALIEIGVGVDTSVPDYKDFYEPYSKKKDACEEAMNAIQNGVYSDGIEYEYTFNDEKYKGKSNGINGLKETEDSASEEMAEIQSELNFKTYLSEYDKDENLYNIYCAYRREDVYSNENYLSTGIELDNAALIDKANEFLEMAKKQIRKSAEPEYTISSSLKNLLLIDSFKPIVDKFKLGNWIRVKVDGQLYRLRLISYSINFGNIQDLSVEFSTVTKEKGVVYDAQQIMKSAKSMSTNFGYVKKQAKKGNDAQDNIMQWKQDGLNSGLVKIQNNDNEEVVYDKHGLLCRSFDEITGTYSDEQMKITHNILAFTSDNWKTVRQLIGNHEYSSYDEENNEWITTVGYGNSADFVTSGHIFGSTIVGGTIMSSNFSVNKENNSIKDKYNCSGSFIDLQEGTFSFAGKLTWDGDNLKIDQSTFNANLDAVDIVTDLKVKAENVEGKFGPNKINLEELKEQVEVKAENIDGKITSDQIEFIQADKIEGEIQSEKISSTLSDKTFNNPVLNGIIKTNNSDVEYIGITKDITIGTTILKFVNGLLVEVIEANNP